MTGWMLTFHSEPIKGMQPDYGHRCLWSAWRRKLQAVRNVLVGVDTLGPPFNAVVTSPEYAAQTD